MYLPITYTHTHHQSGVAKLGLMNYNVCNTVYMTVGSIIWCLSTKNMLHEGHGDVESRPVSQVCAIHTPSALSVEDARPWEDKTAENSKLLVSTKQTGSPPESARIAKKTPVKPGTIPVIPRSSSGDPGSHSHSTVSGAVRLAGPRLGLPVPAVGLGGAEHTGEGLSWPSFHWRAPAG